MFLLGTFDSGLVDYSPEYSLTVFLDITMHTSVLDMSLREYHEFSWENCVESESDASNQHPLTPVGE